MHETPVYPEPEPMVLDNHPRFWTARCRVVIPCFNLEQAERIAEQVAEFCSCDLERLICITDDPATKVLSETVMERTFYPVKGLEAPAENEANTVASSPD